MTAHPIDTEALREKSETLGFYGDRPELCDEAVYGLWAALAAAEHRATRAEAQSAIRGRAVVIYHERARQAEAERDCRRRENAELRDELVATQEYGAKLAHGKDEAEERIEAVQDLIDQADTAGDWAITCSRLQWAIDGTSPRTLDGDA